MKRIRVKDSFTRIWWMAKDPHPRASNRRVLIPYSDSMNALLKSGKYNSGRRPSQHVIGSKSFLARHKGAIPPNVLTAVNESEEQGNVLVGSNTRSSSPYLSYCKELKLTPHPARMPEQIAEFFIKLCTYKADLVLDPFAGSNTTGAAAERLGRQWISVEMNRDYVRGGHGRFLDTQ